MLTFTSDELERIGRARFITTMRRLLREQYATYAEDMTDAQLDAFIADQLDCAQRYGLNDEQSAGVFVLTAWLFGEGFDRRIPVMVQVLGDAGLAPVTKAKFMEDFALVFLHRLTQGSAPGREAQP